MARRGQKRQQRKRERRRAQSGSPYRLIGSSGELVACYVNSDWKPNGTASIYVLRRVPGGGHAMGAFLVDLWCMGLKDAWGRLDISYADFNESIRGRMPVEIELVRVDLETIKRLVAGGIRFARQNGFRLPVRYERWVALLGDIGDPDDADLNDFGVDGGLRFIGNCEDLKRRLIDCSVDEFLARKDVQYILGDDDFTLLDDDALAVDEGTELLREKGLSAVRQWCFANGEVPHPRLPEAWDIMVEAMMQTEELPEDEELDDAAAAGIHSRMDTLLSLEPDCEADCLEALDQLREFVQQFDSPEALSAALGLEEELDDEE